MSAADTPGTITARDILYALDDACEWADGVDVDNDVMAPVIGAVRRRYPHMSLIDCEMMLADARAQIAPLVDDLVQFGSLRACFKQALAREFGDDD
jgi:hypothetical protein